ncbi:hypothetical protein ANANG_G00156850 [Anguilla anguilla]|uniref:Uncharacterized protein n=1 Tax=Anguilla anguilla TaxID=7936 RepID=A0A9D3RYK8_ANGAN|nr:hypothetical protein ANANG_G00156850 [Anguilla anguilla]
MREPITPQSLLRSGTAARRAPSPTEICEARAPWVGGTRCLGRSQEAPHGVLHPSARRGVSLPHPRERCHASRTLPPPGFSQGLAIYPPFPLARGWPGNHQGGHAPSLSPPPSLQDCSPRVPLVTLFRRHQCRAVPAGALSSRRLPSRFISRPPCLPHWFHVPPWPGKESFCCIFTSNAGRDNRGNRGKRQLLKRCKSDYEDVAEAGKRQRWLAKKPEQQNWSTGLLRSCHRSASHLLHET